MWQNVWSFLLSVTIIFAFVMWFWLLITVIGDLIRRGDAGGFKKVLWVILLFITPFLGVFLYLLTQSRGMAERNDIQRSQARAELRDFVGYSRADELEKLEKLKASGVINPDEFTKLRAQVLT
ncbi:MAG: SHOCT domain-containing protein [Porphyrobacter sp.]|nr:SHOCT domain-containing protein [Porphyrobacter sp.]